MAVMKSIKDGMPDQFAKCVFFDGHDYFCGYIERKISGSVVWIDGDDVAIEVDDFPVLYFIECISLTI